MNFKLVNPWSRMKILDPEGSFLQTWNKIFLVSCVLAISLDAFFFYAPVINRHDTCLDLDGQLQIIACVLRTLIDIFYILHIIIQFRTGFLAPSSRVFGDGELIDDPSVIAKRYLPYFIIVILSILPLPQVVVFIVNPQLKSPVSFITKDFLKFVILSQLVPRLVRIYPLYKEVTTTSGMLIETAWAGAAINLFFYMLASHVVGALWYLLSIERQDQCWRNWCGVHNVSCSYLYCGVDRIQDDFAERYAFLNASCPLTAPDGIENSTVFNFGIFIKALHSRVVEFSYCFWWGLRNLSSLGSNLDTSPFIGEILFAVFISIFRLILFSLLVGNMQKYLQNLQSIAARIEEEREKRKNTELWMSHRMLPEGLRMRIRRYRQYKWKKTKGIEENGLINDLPKDLRRDIKRHLRLALLGRMPVFARFDDLLLDAMCDRLKPVLYTEDSYIVREGDPIDEMLFIVRGKLMSISTDGGRTGFFNLIYLKAGDFYGEELLPWALESQSSSFHPISTRTLRAMSEVEASALTAHDLKSLVSYHFLHPLHRKWPVHILRFCSQKWMTWAACFIQVAWWRYQKRKQNKALQEEADDRLQDALLKAVGTSTTLGATNYASRFAANMLRVLRRNGGSRARLPQRSWFPLPPKPSDPQLTV